MVSMMTMEMVIAMMMITLKTTDVMTMSEITTVVSRKTAVMNYQLMTMVRAEALMVEEQW